MVWFICAITDAVGVSRKIWYAQNKFILYILFIGPSTLMLCTIWFCSFHYGPIMASLRRHVYRIVCLVDAVSALLLWAPLISMNELQSKYGKVNPCEYKESHMETRASHAMDILCDIYIATYLYIHFKCRGLWYIVWDTSVMRGMWHATWKFV